MASTYPGMLNTAVITTPNVALVSVVVLGANSGRRGLLIYNNSSNSCYVTLGPVANGGTLCCFIIASFTNFTALANVAYGGVLSSIRNAGTGNLVITEFYA